MPLHDGPLGGREPGEVAEVEQQGGEVRDDEADDHEEFLDRTGHRQLGAAEVHGQVAAGLDQYPDGQGDHDAPDGGPGQVLEPPDRLHAPPDQQQLQGPDHQEADPAEGGEAEEPAVGQRRQPVPHLEEQDLDRHRRQVGLDPVPGDADDGPHDGGQVGPLHAEADPGQHRVGHAEALAGDAGEVHQSHHHEGPEDQPEEHPPPVEPQEEQPRREGVAPHAVDVGHPHAEQAVHAPVPLGRRGQVLVVQLRAVPVRYAGGTGRAGLRPSGPFHDVGHGPSSLGSFEEHHRST